MEIHNNQLLQKFQHGFANRKNCKQERQHILRKQKNNNNEKVVKQTLKNNFRWQKFKPCP